MGYHGGSGGGGGRANLVEFARYYKWGGLSWPSGSGSANGNAVVSQTVRPRSRDSLGTERSDDTDIVIEVAGSNPTHCHWVTGAVWKRQSHNTKAISFTPLCQCLSPKVSDETLNAVGPFYPVYISMPVSGNRRAQG